MEGGGVTIVGVTTLDPHLPPHHPHHKEGEGGVKKKKEAIMKHPPFLPTPSSPSPVPASPNLPHQDEISKRGTTTEVAMQKPQQEGEGTQRTHSRKCGGSENVGAVSVCGGGGAVGGGGVCGALPTTLKGIGRGAVPPPPPQPLLPQDDLRAYAYEGDGSPSSCLSSAVLGECSVLLGMCCVCCDPC